MPEASQERVTRRVVVEGEKDRLVGWAVWGAVFLALMLVAVIVYGLVTGAFDKSVPQTAQDYALAATAEEIARNPKNGVAYAQRAEALYKLDRVPEAFEVLDAGEKAVGKNPPSILFVLRTRIMLLNQEERFAEASKIGARAMDLSDGYLSTQIKSLTAKGIIGAGSNLDTRASVDIAVQYGTALVAQKKYDEAVKLYSWALMYEPAAADILSLRGWAYVSKGSEASATADFKEALQYLPGDPSATEGLKRAQGGSASK